jgi:hypothetical protein
MNIGENIGKWLGFNYENKEAIPTTNPQPKRSQPSKPIGTKPDGYKSINSSSIIFRQPLS